MAITPCVLYVTSLLVKRNLEICKRPRSEEGAGNVGGVSF
jgi:hypothetical protein